MSRSLIPDSPLLRAALEACAGRHTRVWLVGGALRDALLGRPVHDLDLAVERGAIEIAREAAARLGVPMYVLDAGRDAARVVAHDASGTRVFLDFARLREATLEADLAGRDFTINAMALDPAQPERLIDPFDGQADIAARLVRATGDRSLLDDPIRLLRATRQSLDLAFSIEPDTAARIRQSAALIHAVSAERVRDELAQIVARPAVHDGLRLLDQLNLLAEVLPELAAARGVTQSSPHHWDVFEHTLRLLDVLERLLAEAIGIESQRRAHSAGVAPESAWVDIERALNPLRAEMRDHFEKVLSDDRPAWHMLKWAAIFHDTGKPVTRSIGPDGRIRFFGHEDVGAGLAAERLQALRFSASEIDRAAMITRQHMRPHHLLDTERDPSRRAAYRFFRDAGEAGVDVLLLSLVDHLATHGPDLSPDRWPRRLEWTRALLTEYFRRREETVNPPPLITGKDVMSLLGLQPGPRVGTILEAVREAQAAGDVRTREAALALARALNLRHDAAGAGDK